MLLKKKKKTLGVAFFVEIPKKNTPQSLKISFNSLKKKCLVNTCILKNNFTLYKKRYFPNIWMVIHDIKCDMF